MSKAHKEPPLTFAGVDRLLHNAGDKYLLLLLTECSEPKRVKPGTHALSVSVLDYLTAREGPLDRCLQSFAGQRPSKVSYHRLPLSRNDTRTLTRIGVCWLPQVRIVRRDRILFRSSVSVGDNHEFLAQDVGGSSIMKNNVSTGLTNLLDALSLTIDK